MIYSLYAGIAAFIASMFSPKKYVKALRWTGGILVAFFGYKKFAEPIITSALAGPPPEGYTQEAAQADIAKIVDWLCLDKSSSWYNYIYIWNAMDLPDHIIKRQPVIDLLNSRSGANNRYMARVWQLSRQISFVEETAGVMQEYSTQINAALTKQP